MGGLTFTNLTRELGIGANCYALDVAGRRLVLDCGMHPTHDGSAALPELGLLDDDSVETVLLTHAHHDHLGSLPVLMRRQPRARVFMTEATSKISEVMLHNSVNVMQREHEVGKPVPLFTHREVDRGVKRWQAVPLQTRFSLDGERLPQSADDEPSIELHDAGHVLGSAGVMIRAGGRSVFYAGDVNFDDQSLMRAARFPGEPLDVLIIETTRGERALPAGWTRAAEEERLTAAIEEAFAAGGLVLMPVFALGKTQEMLTFFHGLRQRGRMKSDTPIYIGGLGAKLTEIHDKLAHETPRQHQGLKLLDAVSPYVISGRNADDAPVKPGRIYALSSGMMTEHTLSNVFAQRILGDPRHAILFVGYADPESPAGRLRHAQRGDEIQLAADAEPRRVECRIERFNFSGHASRESILAFILRAQPKTVVLVHGDAPALEWFRTEIAAALPATRIVLPQPGAEVEL